MSVLDISEDSAITGISQGAALDLSSGTGVKDIANAPGGPLDLGEPATD